MDRSLNGIDIRERVHRFQHLLRENGVDGTLVVQKVDLYYFCGMDQDAHLWIPASGEPLLMVRKSLERAIQDALMDQIIPFERYSQIPELIKKYYGQLPGRMGLEMDILPANMYLAYQRNFPGVKMVDVSHHIMLVRMIKSPYEVSLIRKAAEMGDRLLERIPEFINTSVTEKGLSLHIESFCANYGYPCLCRVRAFNGDDICGHIMGGPSATVASASPGPTGGTGLGPYLSNGAGNRQLAPHEPIFVDYTTNVEGYLSDQTRIFSIGELPAKFERAHRAMIEVQNMMVREGNPGVKAKDLYNLALRIVDEAGLSEGFMGHPKSVPFVGHGVGLELDEWPVIGRNVETTLQKGMVIALEPKIMFPGEGVVGIENTFVVTDSGMERLNSFSDELGFIPYPDSLDSV